MTSLKESFVRFSRDLNQIAESEGKKAASHWEYTLQTGTLTKLINDTFYEIGKTHYSILNQDRGRNTTIQPSIYEIFLGKLIKHLLEEKMKDDAIEVVLDDYLAKLRKNPDVLIRKKGEKEPIGIIELKHILLKKPYETERKRRTEFLTQYASLKAYSIILYAIYNKSVLASIVEDRADWIYIIRYEESAKKYRDKANIPFLNRANPVELALNEIING